MTGSVTGAATLQSRWVIRFMHAAMGLCLILWKPRRIAVSRGPTFLR